MSDFWAMYIISSNHSVLLSRSITTGTACERIKYITKSLYFMILHSELGKIIVSWKNKELYQLA